MQHRASETTRTDWLSYIVLSGYLLAPKVGVLDFSILFLIFGFIIRVRQIVLNKSATHVLFAFAVIFLLVLFSALINQNVSLENILKPVRNFLAVGIIYSYCMRRQISLEQVFDVIVLAGAINGITVLLQFLFVLAGWDASVLRFYPEGETVGGLRQPGLSSGYPSSGMLCCMAATVALYRFFYTNKYKHFLGLLLCIPGVFLSARTSVVLFLAVFAILIVSAVYQRKGQFLSVVGTVFALLGVMVGAAIAMNPQIYETFYIMFEFAFVYLDEGSVGVSSTDDLLANHYFLPDDLVGWIVGNARSAWGDGGIPSDVWFVQNLVGSGVFVTVLYLLIFFYIFFVAFNNCTGRQKAIISTLFAMVLISSFKASFIFSRFVGDVVTLAGVCALSMHARNSARTRSS